MKPRPPSSGLSRRAFLSTAAAATTLMFPGKRAVAAGPAAKPRFRVEPVDPGPLADRVRESPGLRLVLLNAFRALRGEPLRNLVAAGEVWVEIATLEGVGGLAGLLEQVPSKSVLFGSHAPFFYFESALLKLQESGLSQDQLRAVRFENAQRLLS